MQFFGKFYHFQNRLHIQVYCYPIILHFLNIMSSSIVVAVVFKVLVRRQIVKYLETIHEIPI